MVEPAPASRVYVVGLGAEGWESLAPRAKEVVAQADTVVGGERLLALVPHVAAERLVIKAGLAGLLEQIATRLGERRVVVLASGDPGFFGIAKALVERFGKERVEILPNVSAVQLAFARIKESWEDATFVSLHGRLPARFAAAVGRSRKVAILTDDVNSPAVIARSLLAAGLGGYHAYVCEDLGLPDERVRECDLATLTELATAPLNVLILIREQAAEEGEAAYLGQPASLTGGWPYGIPDEEFYQRRPHRGLITKVEVRLASLAKLALTESSTVWDIGAGSGAVTIEAALAARLGRVFAVERDAESIDLIRRNIAKFGVANVVPVHGTAPAALAALPAPDAVFVGGSGGQLAAIVDAVDRQLRAGGRVVVNATTVETAGAALAALREKGFAVTATLLQVSRGKELAGLTHFEALDPVFVIAARRGRS